MKTRAALFRAAGAPLEVRELDAEEPGPGEVCVRMAAVGVCGSDLHVVKGEWPRPTPMVLGHEGSGTVESVGPGVTSHAAGDRVVLSWAPSCGNCRPCLDGFPARCEPLREAIGRGTLVDGRTGISLDGATVYRMTSTGCLAERVVVRANAALPLPDEVSIEQGALLGCAALTGVGAVLFRARPQPGTTALVLGAGGVGQFVVQGARIAGASAIVAVDPAEGRRAQAVRLGATHAVPPEDLAETLAQVAPDGVDHAYDAVGHTETTGLAFAATRAGGTCVIVGMPAAGARLDLDSFDFTNREKTLTGTIYGSEDPAVALPVLLEHVRTGALRLQELVGPSFPLDEVDAAMQASLDGSPGRVLVTP